MNKLKEINSVVKLTLDKLTGIRAYLVRLDDNWQEWDFAKTVDSLKRWTDRNPKNILNNAQKHRREGVFQTKEQKQTPCACVYCDKLCLISNSKHHTSICDRNENVLLTTNSDACVYPLVTVSIEGIECCALVDTTAGASYVSSTIVSLINRKTNKKPISTESK